MASKCRLIMTRFQPSVITAFHPCGILYASQFSPLIRSFYSLGSKNMLSSVKGYWVGTENWPSLPPAVVPTEGKCTLSLVFNDPARTDDHLHHFEESLITDERFARCFFASFTFVWSLLFYGLLRVTIKKNSVKNFFGSSSNFKPEGRLNWYFSVRMRMSDYFTID